MGIRTRQDVLQLLAALPAEIERLGWPRGLVVPPHMQLASYAPNLARYAPHLDDGIMRRTIGEKSPFSATSIATGR